MNDKEQIKERLRLEEIIGEVVTLNTGPNHLQGLCPFHLEKTPSFSVNTKVGVYYCFGCQAKGDLFSFVQNTQNMNFHEALEHLAQRADVKLSRPSGPKDLDLFDLNDLAQAYFSEGYAASETAQHYLGGRSFTAETIASWGLGYAPAGWQGLIDYARTLGVTSERLAHAGLVARGKTGKLFDFFRNRVTVPIRNPFGRIVGFSARAVAASEKTKYINTPETAIFKKRELLFGLDRARVVIKDKRASIVAEGPLDVIALHQAGYSAAVGAQTAALTTEQIALLERLGAARLYLAFDADEAGKKGVLKTFDGVERRMTVKVARLPYKDPAEVLQRDPSLFRQALKTAFSEAEYRLSQCRAKFDLTQPHERTAALKELRPALQDASTPGDADELVQLVVTELGYDEDRIRRWLARDKAALPPRPQRHEPVTTDTLSDLRAQLMALALSDRVFLKEACSRLDAHLPANDPLKGFIEVVQQAEYDPRRAIERYSEDSALYAYIAAGISKPQHAFGLALNHYNRVIKVLAPAVAP